MSGGGDYYNRNGQDMSNVVSDHGDELASWGLADYTDAGQSQFDAPKYTYSSSPAQYEPVNKYGPQPGGPQSPYADKYKRVDETHVRPNDCPPTSDRFHDRPRTLRAKLVPGNGERETRFRCPRRREHSGRVNNVRVCFGRKYE